MWEALRAMMGSRPQGAVALAGSAVLVVQPPPEAEPSGSVYEALWAMVGCVGLVSTLGDHKGRPYGSILGENRPLSVIMKLYGYA